MQFAKRASYEKHRYFCHPAGLLADYDNDTMITIPLSQVDGRSTDDHSPGKNLCCGSESVFKVLLSSLEQNMYVRYRSFYG